MNVVSGSSLTRALFWLCLVVQLIGLALALALLLSLGGYFVASWQSAPVSEISAWLVFVVVPLVVLRLALTSSMRRDRRGQT